MRIVLSLLCVFFLIMASSLMNERVVTTRHFIGNIIGAAASAILAALNLRALTQLEKK